MATALSDLAKIQKSLQQKKQKVLQKRQREEEKQRKRPKHEDVMKFVVDTLKKEPNHQLLSPQLNKKIKRRYDNDDIEDLLAMKAKSFFKSMHQKQLIEYKLKEDGYGRIIKLIEFNEDLINKKIEGIEWYDKHKDEMNRMITLLKGIFAEKKREEMTMASLTKLLGKKYHKPVVMVFGIKKIKDFWDYLQNERKEIVIRTTLDGSESFISLKTEDTEIRQPPFKKMKLEQYINDFNDGEMDEIKMVDKIMKKLNKLEERHEIHFHFKLGVSEFDDESTDGDSDSDEDSD